MPCFFATHPTGYFAEYTTYTAAELCSAPHFRNMKFGMGLLSSSRQQSKKNFFLQNFIFKRMKQMPTSTDYPQPLWKIAEFFSFLRITENSNFSTGIFLKSSNQKFCQKSAKSENMISDGVEFSRSIVFQGYCHNMFSVP